MAIFNSGSVSTNSSSVATTIIAYGTVIKGDIQLKCNLHVDGEIEGGVQTIGNVVIGKSGVAKGELHAKSISISGLFEGTIDADSVEILQGGKLFGIVVSKGFIIETNGLFEGQSSLKVEHESTPAANQSGATDVSAKKQDKKLSAV